MTSRSKRFKEIMKKAMEEFPPTEEELVKAETKSSVTGKPRGNARRSPKRDNRGRRIPVATQRAVRAKRDADWANKLKEPTRDRSGGEAPASPASGIPDKHGHVLAHSDAEWLSREKNHQTFANCKRHRTMGHRLSPKCQFLLARDAARGTGTAPYSDLDIAFVDGRKFCSSDDMTESQKKCCERAKRLGSKMTESEKYFSDMAIKALFEKPEENMYEVRAANCAGRRQKGSKYVTAPIFDTARMKEEAIKGLLNEFFRDPKLFMQTHPDYSYETIVIRAILDDDDDEALEGDSTEYMADASMPGVLAASASELTDSIATDVETIMKARKALKR